MLPLMETFVVRVWAPAGGDPGEDAGLRGVAEHVASGRRLTFRSPGDLLAFLRTPDTVVLEPPDIRAPD